jgi:protein phosphatase
MIKTFTLFGITDVGRQRTHNEDNFVISRDVSANEWGFRRDAIVEAGAGGALLIVADGMGGTNAGEVASHLAQESVQKAFQQLDTIPESSSKREKFLRNCILNAHEQIVEHQHKHLDTAGMGTTLVIAWVIGDRLHAAWSGDSRCYVYDGTSPLQPFTDDHSMVWQLVKKGSLTPEEARTHPESNLILQSLGSPENRPKPSVRSTKLRAGNRVLVCSDGLNGMLPDQRIEQLLSEGNATAETCADLVKQANMAGGEDNITCLLLDVLETDEQPAKTKKGSGAATVISGQTSDDENAVDESPADSADAFEQAANATLSDKHEDNPGRSGRSRMLFAGIFIILLAGLLYVSFRPDTPEPSPNEITPEENDKSRNHPIESGSLNSTPEPEMQESEPPSVPEPVEPESETEPSPETENESPPEQSEPEFRVPPDESANTSKPAGNMQQESKPSVNDDKETNMPADSAGVVIPDSVSAGSTKPAAPDTVQSGP